MQSDAQRRHWLRPQAVYGYWPCQAEGETLVIYAPDTKTEISRFTFPRQADKERLCLADYFAPAASASWMWWPCRWSPWAGRPRPTAQALQAAGDYSGAYFAHGLAVQTAEATAAWLHHRIRQELGIGQPGPAIFLGLWHLPGPAGPHPGLQAPAGRAALGMSLTSACQLVPEQSTAAIVVHHPEARYFTVGRRLLGILPRVHSNK